MAIHLFNPLATTDIFYMPYYMTAEGKFLYPIIYKQSNFLCFFVPMLQVFNLIEHQITVGAVV